MTYTKLAPFESETLEAKFTSLTQSVDDVLVKQLVSVWSGFNRVHQFYKTIVLAIKEAANTGLKVHSRISIVVG